MPDVTYIDRYIADGQKATISMRNIYDTILVGSENNTDHIYRIGIDDFFLKYRSQLDQIVQWYNVPETVYYKPKTMSLQLYGTTELWLSILRLNNMKNITEFHYPIIKVYNPNSLRELMQIFFKREKKI